MSFEEESACLISREVSRFSQRRSAFSCLVLRLGLILVNINILQSIMDCALPGLARSFFFFF